MSSKGYTRRQAAKKAGIGLRTLDQYVHDGVATGRVQYVEDHGHMRVFSDTDIDHFKAEAERRKALQPNGLRTYHHGLDDEATPEGDTP